MIEKQLKKIKETLERVVEENVTINLRGYFFQNFEEGRTKEKALEMATLAKGFGFGRLTERVLEGIKWIEIDNDYITLIIYYTSNLEE